MTQSGLSQMAGTAMSTATGHLLLCSSLSPRLREDRHGDDSGRPDNKSIITLSPQKFTIQFQTVQVKKNEALPVYDRGCTTTGK